MIDLIVNLGIVFIAVFGPALVFIGVLAAVYYVKEWVKH